MHTQHKHLRPIKYIFHWLIFWVWLTFWVGHLTIKLDYLTNTAIKLKQFALVVNLLFQ